MSKNTCEVKNWDFNKSDLIYQSFQSFQSCIPGIFIQKSIANTWSLLWQNHQVLVEYRDLAHWHMHMCIRGSYVSIPPPYLPIYQITYHDVWIYTVKGRIKKYTLNTGSRSLFICPILISHCQITRHDLWSYYRKGRFAKYTPSKGHMGLAHSNLSKYLVMTWGATTEKVDSQSIDPVGGKWVCPILICLPDYFV